MFKTQKYIDEESRVVDIAKENGLIAKMITKEDLKILEPNIEIDAVGASYYNCDSHTTPKEFMCNMKNYLLQNGVKLIKNTEVTDINIIPFFIFTSVTSVFLINLTPFCIK